MDPPSDTDKDLENEPASEEAEQIDGPVSDTDDDAQMQLANGDDGDADDMNDIDDDKDYDVDEVRGSDDVFDGMTDEQIQEAENDYLYGNEGDYDEGIYQDDFVENEIPWGQENVYDVDGEVVSEEEMDD